MSQGTAQKLRHYRVEGCIMSKSNSPESDDRPNLRVVSSPEAEVYDLMRAPETTAERVKRLQAEGLLHGTDVDAPRTGAKRRELSLTDLGAEFLAGVTEHLVDPSSID